MGPCRQSITSEDAVGMAPACRVPPQCLAAVRGDSEARVLLVKNRLGGLARTSPQEVQVTAA